MALDRGEDSLPLERVNPDQPKTSELYREHVIRYLFATQFCNDRSVVDAGCGVGYGVDILRQAAVRDIVGLDRSFEAISYAQEHYVSPESHFVIGDCLALPFTEKSRDVIVSFETIEHLTDPSRFVCEVRRVLASDGLAIISTPNRDTYPPGNPFHLHEFNQYEFETLVNQAFPYCRIYHQALVGAHRITPAGADVSDMTIPERSLTFGTKSALQKPDYFIAICSAGPIPLPDDAVLLQSAGDLQRHCANLEEAKVHQIEHIRQLEDRYARDTNDLRGLASSLQLEIGGLRKNSDNLNEHNRRLEERYARDTNELRSHASSLQLEISNLQKHCGNLNEHNRQLEERYARDTNELRSHASNLQLEISNLQKHCENLEDALVHTRRRCDLLEERYARETGELQTHALNLQMQINDLRNH